MNRPATSTELEQSLAAIEDELAELYRRDAQLQAALDEVHHDIRRCNDAMERAGWRSTEAEARGSLLEESRAAIVDDREKNRARQAELSERLIVLEKRINEIRDHG